MAQGEIDPVKPKPEPEGERSETGPHEGLLPGRQDQQRKKKSGDRTDECANEKSPETEEKFLQRQRRNPRGSFLARFPAGGKTAMQT